MYGGRREVELRSDSAVLNAVFVLSLPSFIWQKENSTAKTGRYLHSCNVVGSRQMMVIGGLVTNATVYQEDPDLANGIGANSIPDPWPQGIGMFDLSNFSWKDNYDANAKPYVTPDIVKNAIKANGSFPAQWASSQVQGWFNSSSTSTTANSSTPTSPPSQTTAPNTKSSGSHTGAIVGGVIGGVAIVALLTTALFFLIRRSRNQHRSATGSQQSGAFGSAKPKQYRVFAKSELPGTGLVEMGTDTTRTEPSELPTTPEIAEVSGSTRASKYQGSAGR